MSTTSDWHFATPTSASRASTRLLLVTHAFPPLPEAGSARWEGLAVGLTSRGVTIDVLTRDPNDFAQPDWRRLESLATDLRIWGIPDPSYPLWFRLLRSVVQRRSAATMAQQPDVPRTSVSRVQSGVTVGTSQRVRAWLVERALASQWHEWQRRVHATFRANSLSADIVISSGPPHHLHQLGRQLADKMRVPHVIDLRDPWKHGIDGVDDSIAASRRREILQRADAILSNTPRAKSQLVSEFPETAPRIHVISNAVDLPPQEWRGRSDEFVIAHCGSLYLDRDPRPFLRALRRLCDSVDASAIRVRMIFYGPLVSIDGVSLEAIVAQLGLSGHVEFGGRRPREEVFELLGRSTVAVAFQGDTPTQVPAKVFDYMSFPVDLLALVGRESATADLLAQTSAVVLDMDDEDGIFEALLGSLGRCIEGVRPVPISSDARFSRAHQSDTLADLLANLV